MQGDSQPAARRVFRSRFRGQIAILVVLGALISAVGAVSGCNRAETADPGSATATRLLAATPLPVGPVAASPWSTQACAAGQKSAEVVACVGGAAITTVRVQEVRASYPADTPVRAIVQALVDEELLAQSAAKTLWGPWLEPLLRKRMVAHLLEVQFEREYGEAQVTEEDLKAAWGVKQIRHTYDHPGVYVVTDAQIICCRGSPKQCVESPEAQKCIDDLTPTAEALAKFLNDSPPRSAQEMHGRVGADPRFAKAAVTEVTFFHDPTKPYNEQKGYVTMVQAFAEAAILLQPGQLTPKAVRSEYGWHVIRMEKRNEPEHGTLTDAHVRAELRKVLVDALRDDKVDLLIEQLAKSTQVTLYLGVFDAL